MYKKLKKSKIAIISISLILIIFFLGIFAPYIAPNDPNKVNAALKYAKFSLQFPLGNDYLGRCILSRLIYGIRPSIILVIMAMMGTITIGTAIGLIAGYFKGKVDEFLMRICDVMLSFPADAMVLASIGIFGRGLLTILLTMVLLRWTWYARVIRSSVLKYTDKSYISFAKATGCSSAHIIFKHILPSVLPDISVMATNNICSMILSVSAFSFLGLGIEAPNAEWGMMLSEAKSVMLVHPLQILPPAIAIVIVCVSFSFIGDALRDSLDSRFMSNSFRKRIFMQEGAKKWKTI